VGGVLDNAPPLPYRRCLNYTRGFPGRLIRSPDVVYACRMGSENVLRRFTTASPVNADR